MTSIKALLIISIFGFSIHFLSSCKLKPAETSEPTTVQDTQTIHSTSTSARPVHWGYEGENGPAAWGTLSPAYSLCLEGTGQSPINLTKTDAGGEIKWNIEYKTTALKITHHDHVADILDNGHTIQVNIDEGSSLSIGNRSYHLKQFHFHTPSEHTVDGQHMPMEVHFVHQSEDGNLAVLGVFFTEGKVPNEHLAKIIANLPDAKGETKHLTDHIVDLKHALPKDNFAYHYRGSLTTPPCSENVQWLVLRDMLSATPDQIQAMSNRLGMNSRPVQPLNYRRVQGLRLIGTGFK